MTAQPSTPTRVYGVDPLPARCGRCGSRGLSVEPPIGSDLGRVVCALCSHQPVWLQSPPSAPPLVKLPRFVRLPTCSGDCSALDGHDPSSHERVATEHARREGYEQGRVEGYRDGHEDGFRAGADAEESHARCLRIRPLSLAGVAEVGPLRIDGDRLCATLDGQQLPLSRREAQLLCVLAARPGKPVLYREIVASVWGRSDHRSARQIQTDAHLCRVSAIRLRAKLGDAAGMVETVASVGFMLVTGA